MEIMSFRFRNRVKTKKQKKVFTENWRVFAPESSADQKKGLHRNLVLYSAGICGICLSCQALFRLISQRSNLDGGRKVGGGTLTLDGGTRPPTI